MLTNKHKRSASSPPIAYALPDERVEIDVYKRLTCVLALNLFAGAFKTFQTNLESVGFHVIRVYRSNEILEWLYASKVDLLIMDALWPDTDGFQIIDKLRENATSAGTPIILLAIKESEPDSMQMRHDKLEQLSQIAVVKEAFPPLQRKEFVGLVEDVLRANRQLLRGRQPNISK